MTGKPKGSNYSMVEQKLFLQILKNYSHVIENKKSDSVTLGEKAEAWNSIAEKYNSSALISGKRDVKQLKKLWTNMKTKQRTALTHEKQHRLATGGGPPIQEAEIDPDIMLIAPSLNTTAPFFFSSNIGDDELAAKRSAVDMMEGDDYTAIESLLNVSDDESLSYGDVIVEGNVTSTEASTSGVSGATGNDLKTLDNNFRTKSSVVTNVQSRKRRTKENSLNEEEKSYTTERLTKIIKQEERLFCQKLKYEQEIHDLKMAHLKQRHELEIRAATATAQLAELNLLREQNKDCNSFQYD